MAVQNFVRLEFMNRRALLLFTFFPLYIFSSLLDACSAVRIPIADSHGVPFANSHTEVVSTAGSGSGAAGTQTTIGQRRVATFPHPKPEITPKLVYIDGMIYPYTEMGLKSGVAEACNGTIPGRVVLPFRQTIHTDAPVAVPNNCTIAGNGINSVIQGSFAGPILVNASANPEEITFRDFCLDGDSSTNHRNQGILFPGVKSPTDILIENVYVRNVGGRGITIYGSTSAIGHGLTIQGVHVLNAGISHAPQLAGIVFREINDVQVSNTEVTGAGLVYGMTGFDAIPTSAGNSIHNISIDRWSIHDIGQILQGGGTAIDIGRVRDVRISNGICRNVASGQCITLESVWHGTAFGNEGMSEVIPPQQSMVLVTNPDTTEPGEVGSWDIHFKNNTWHCSWVSLGSCETANKSIDGITFEDTVLLDSTAPVAGVLLQPGSTDPNIVASGWGQGRNINVFSRVENDAPLINNFSVCVCIIQQTTQVVDNINIQNGKASGCHIGVAWSSISAANGITNMTIRNMAFVYDKFTVGALDAHLYTSIDIFGNSNVIDPELPRHFPF